MISAIGQADDGQLLSAVLPALRPHREGPAERRRARGRGQEARRHDRRAREGAADRALQRPGAVRGRRRGRPHPLHARAAPRRHAGARGPVARRRPSTFGGALTDKVGLRVLVAEPRRSSTIRPRSDGGGKALIGGYKIDDEGVACAAVEVVKDGTLEDAADEPHAVAEGPDVERPRAAHRRRRRVPRQRDEPVRHRQGRRRARKALEQKLVAAAKRRGPQVRPHHPPLRRRRDHRRARVHAPRAGRR